MKALRRTVSLTKGLIPTSNAPYNSNWLLEASGVRMGSGGLELQPSPTDPLNITVSWPWPQVVNLQQEVIVIQADGLYTADASWNLSQILTISTDNDVVWQFVDYGDYWYATNGSTTYLRDVSGGSISDAQSSSFPTVGTLVDFNGQLVGGNVQSSWYDCDDEYAVWGNVGSNSFSPDQKNEAGYRHMGIGTIYKALVLASRSIVFYGSEGVAMLFPSGNTFGYQLISMMPPLGKNTMGGREKQLYITSEGKLVQLSSEGREFLGFKPHLSGMDADLTRIMVDELRGDFYIADDNDCYLYANQQLTKATKKPTSLCLIDGVLVGPYVDSSGTVLIELQKHDLNIVAMKSVEFAEFGIATDGIVECSMRFWYNLGQDEHSFGWSPVNDSGFGYLGATANVFTIKLRITNATSFRLPYLTYGVKLTDNRIQNQLQTIQDGSWDAD